MKFAPQRGGQIGPKMASRRTRTRTRTRTDGYIRQDGVQATRTDTDEVFHGCCCVYQLGVLRRNVVGTSLSKNSSCLPVGCVSGAPSVIDDDP